MNTWKKTKQNKHNIQNTTLTPQHMGTAVFTAVLWWLRVTETSKFQIALTWDAKIAQKKGTGSNKLVLSMQNNQKCYFFFFFSEISNKYL